MDQKEREEVYERIPWEALERSSGDRNWIVYAVAGAAVVGALAYSFTRNQPVSPQAAEPPPATTIPTTTAPVATAPPSTVASPMVITEADLYAVDPERLIDTVAAHAEWFAMEYISVDGSGHSSLVPLLPEGIPVPEAPQGTQVFVDWARASSVIEVAPGRFEVDVTVRTLVAEGDSGFRRHPTRSVTVPIDASAGVPVVAGAPTVYELEPAPAPAMGLTELPEDVVVPEGVEVVGGVQLGDGSWEVVALVTGSDGVKRPVRIEP